MAFSQTYVTYWTATSAVAPVIALAAIVSLNDLWRQTDRVKGRTWLQLPAQLLPWFQFLNVLLQAYVLGIALLSIAWQRHVYGPSLGVVAVLEVSGLLAVGVGTAGTAFLRFRLGRLETRKARTVALDDSSIERLTAALRGHEPDPPHPPAVDPSA